MARSERAHPAPSPNAATISRVKPKTCWAWTRPWPSTPPTRASASTCTSSRNSAAVLLSRIPCLSSGSPWVKPSSAGVDHEPARPAGREGQHRAEIGDAAVRDPLLGAADLVARTRAVLRHRFGGRLQRREVAARLGLGGAVGHQQALLGDAGHPALLLLGGAARRRSGRSPGTSPSTEVATPRSIVGHALADPVHVDCAAAHPAELLGDEQELDAELLAAHPAYELLRELGRARQARSARVG